MKKIFHTLALLFFAATSMTAESVITLTTAKEYGSTMKLTPVPAEADSIKVDWGDGHLEAYWMTPADMLYTLRKEHKVMGQTIKVYGKLKELSCNEQELTGVKLEEQAELRKLELNGNPGGGIVTALNARVQRIAETALQAAKTQKGAAVVLDVHSGDILACASLPVYNPDELAQALQSEDAPFINRALSAYSVGSVFKLVTAAAALERDLPVSYLYECTGSYTLYGQRFRCHKLSGHGLLDMQQAMTVSCNPYFISLSELLSAEVLHDTAAALGFGHPLTLAPGMQSDSGTLPDVSALSVPAEKANFAFGQGKLTASPMQIAAMTACIANGGIYSEPRLLLGKTSDGKTVSDPEPAVQRRVLSSETAAALQKMMIAVLRDSEHSNAVPCNIYAAGKTSTAQTGRTGADGEELCHAWMTGFFPAYAPKYAVTVLIEDGGSGNDAAAPVFRRIIEETRRCLIK